MRIFQHAYLNLGIDCLGKEIRQINLLKSKKEQFNFLKKRNLRKFQENLEKDQISDFQKENKKIQTNFDFFKIQKNNKINILQNKTSSWMEDIFDKLSEMNKSLFRKLKREYILASKSSQLIFRKTLLMLLNQFKHYFYDYSCDLKQNLQKFINFVSDFFKQNKTFTNFREIKTIHSSLEIE